MSLEELYKTKKQNLTPEKTRESRYMADSKDLDFKLDGSFREKSYYDVINSPDLEHVENWRGSADYIIFKDGATTKALNGTTGKIDLADTDSATVIQYCIDSFSDVKGTPKLIFIKSGIYEISSTINANKRGTVLLGEFSQNRASANGTTILMQADDANLVT